MKKIEFIVFKLGVTEHPVSIISYNGMSASGLPFDRDAKKSFYKNLGYTITEVL